MTDFETYIRQGEPSQVEKAQNWQTAIGLQAVDGLRPSAYLLEQAKLNIEGDITIDEVKNRIDAYYRNIVGKNFFLFAARIPQHTQAFVRRYL
ncbi:MAG: antitoxin VbhA family protein [Spirochaetaceae bacterium]|jgi:hypothetical protein|nr:antitoxin VbhA family protein [Spirochaetaceae bacterium]